MKTLALAVLILACSSKIQAQITPAIDAPRHDKTGILEISALAGAIAADQYETRRLLDRGGVENDPVYGRHPSIARQSAIEILELAGVSAGFCFTERSPRPWVRWTGRLLVAGLTIGHVSAAVYDANQAQAKRGPVIPGKLPH